MIQVCVLSKSAKMQIKRKWEIVFDYRITRCTDKYKKKKRTKN